MADNTVAEEPSTGVKEVDGNKEMGIANDFVEGRLPADKDGDGNTEETSDNVKDGNGLNGDQNLNVGDDKTPQLGMVFKSYGEACYFYKQYAQSVGFAATVRRSSFKENGECLHLILACCKWGKGREGEEYQSRPTAKTNCQASIKLRLRGEGLLHLEKVNLEHNHELNPSITKVYRCFKILSNNKVLRPKSGHNPIQAHERQNYLTVEEDHRNSSGRRHLKLGQGDDEAIQQFFTRLQNKNSHFFYLIDLNEDGCLCNVFWADSRSRAAYKYFGDVMSFDTTYLRDAFQVPLVLFLGVNNHGQSVLLGCGLLSGETIENYIWVFKAFVACMLSKLPNAIVTDHCKAIQGAVAEVFHGVRHRLCLYHIMEKMAERLREYSAYTEIKKTLMKVVYDSLKVEEFEENWRIMIDRYNLEGCEWLNSIYKSRNSWVPVFLKDTFWAGLSTTQPKESITPFFDGFVNSKTSLRRFFIIYEAVLQAKYEKEIEADSDSFNGYWRMVSKFHMEEQLSKLYTLNIFKLFQDELKATMYCDVSLCKVDGVISTFEVKESLFLEDGKTTKINYCEVLYYSDEPKVQCICGSFQSRGILCRHALAVLKFQQVYEIPSHYILSRWQKDYKRLHLLEQSCDDVASKNLMEKYDYLSMRCLQLLEVGLISNDKYQLALKLIREVEKQLLDDSLQGDGNQKNREDLATLQFGFSQNEQVHDSSQQVKRRGRPPKKRKEAEAEAITRSNTGMGSSMTALVGDHRDVLQVGPTSAYLGSHSHIQGGTNLMADVNLNDYSSSSHFGMHVNPQHPVAGLSGIHVNPQHPVAGQSGIQPSIIESQYSPQTIGNHGRSQWLYHQIFQEQQLPRAPHGANR
ncbi:protein FAR1-RELATED SEQUENCE 6-like isoform X2 [Asparagus officinalis]|uniref:protein FAR1-RELATED SEQUENCE 6-like isoform X2 n=1 Tax=Asparagus officinalis TaxID=4686 RepID=UPI00098E2A25|nr:protein FAR1-RELATED SEQUENCE 6-like isoform X2 [Asparagus officinalis]